jgi:hypothetical protein
MTDRKPPKLVAGETDTLLALLGYHRRSLIDKVADLDDGDAGRRFVGSGTTLLWLIQHVAGAERLWIWHRFLGVVPPDVAGGGAGPDTVAGAVADYRAVGAATDEVVRGRSLDEPARNMEGDAPVNLRWVVAHLLEETARHAGHADILRELLDGSTGR